MKKGEINAILADCKVDESWDFYKALCEQTGEKWQIIKSVSNSNHGGKLQNLIRYSKYFSLPLKIFFHRKKYKKILAWQQFFGVILAFYFRLFKVKNPPEIIVMTFIYKEKKSFVGKIYKKFMSYVISSDYIKKYIVYSHSECEIYSKGFGVPKDKFSFILLGYEDSTYDVPSKPSEGYFLSAGRSNRDYAFLDSVWQPKYGKLKIVCDEIPAKNGEYIEYLDDCHENDYLEMLSRCYAVIIPLADTKISSGQLVILQAMMYSKPIIVTQNDTVCDYITNGVDGLIINKNKDDFDAAIEKINSPVFYAEMSENCRKSYNKKFKLYNMGVAASEIIMDSGDSNG